MTMSNKPIYLDYLATTPIAPEVRDAMLGCLDETGDFGNPASRTHVYGWQAEHRVEIARGAIADLIGADPREIIFTSGATEANNLAIKGLFEALHYKGHFVTSAIEHKAVLDPANQLQRKGVGVSFLPATKEGLMDVDALERSLRDDTKLVSIMWVNNELGTINPITEIAQLVKSKGILLHVDAAQAVGKLPINLADVPVDFMSLSGHKLYGPKGIGALFVRRGATPAPVAQIHGGGHERGFRSGTLPTHQIAGFGAAAKLASDRWEEDQAHYASLGGYMTQRLLGLEGATLNGSLTTRLPQAANISFDGVEGEALLSALVGLAISSGSACNSAVMKPSHVLLGIGAGRARADSALRFSLGRSTRREDIDAAIDELDATLRLLRGKPLD
jgi:cysteine desulfurase